MTGSRVKRLAKDMKANGFDQSKAIEAAEVNGRYIIVDGHHRTAAAVRAGIDKVPVKIKTVSPEEAAKLSQDATEAAAERRLQKSY